MLSEQSLQCFLEFAEHILPQSVLRASITAAYRRPEEEVVPVLLEQARLSKEMADGSQKLALKIAENCATRRALAAVRAWFKACCKNSRCRRRKV
uniref:Proline utilization A proline dehydrogenase N-terminal domain-containing protein n=1 Tax=Pseudomonas marincola TaxID=437900 RepID=A0A653DZW7_9PSED